MPTKQRRLTRMEQEEQRITLSRLEQLHLIAKCPKNQISEPRRFTLQQIDPEFARVYDMPHGFVVVAFSARLIILHSGLMFTDASIFPEWNVDGELGMEDVDDIEHLDDVVGGFPTFPPLILNDRFVDQPQPLRPCKLDGLIIASGWNQVPAEYSDERMAKFEILLRDERGNEFEHHFSARVDRSLKRKYERRRADRQIIAEQRIRDRVLLSERATIASEARPGESANLTGQAKRVSANRNIYRETIQ